MVSLTLTNSFASAPALAAGRQDRLAELPEADARELRAGDKTDPATGPPSAASWVPGAHLAVLEGRHFPFYEEPDSYLALVEDFMTRAETTGAQQ